MDEIPKRRHGIDGLSHRPATVHARPHHKPEKTTSPAELKKPVALTHPSEEGFAFNTAVSHPTLPQQQSRIQDRPASSIRKLIGYPFAPGFDRRILKLGIVATSLDVRLWLLLGLPLLAIRAAMLANLAPAKLATAIGDLLVARNYIWGALIVGGFYLVAVVSVLTVTISEQAMTAIKIRRIDHRVSRVHILIRHAVSNILKTTLSWLIDVCLASFVIVALFGTLYWLTTHSPTWLTPWRGYAAGLAVVVCLVVLGALTVRRKLQRAMLATTQLSIGSIQKRSSTLVLHNLGIGTVAIALSLFELALATSLSIAISFGVYTALPSLTTIPARLSVWLIASLVISVVWLGTMLWQVGHWAGLYHIIVLRSRKDEVSDYLVPSEPLKLRMWPALAAASLVLLALSFYVAGVIAFRGSVSSAGKRIKQNIPSGADKLIPGIDGK